MDSVELGETVEIIVDGGRIEAFLSDNVIVLDPASPHARRALRVYAWSLASTGDRRGAKELLARVGREG